MYTTDHSAARAINASVPNSLTNTPRRRIAVRPAPHRARAQHTRLADGRPAVAQVSFLDSTLVDIAVLDLMYFPGRLTNDGGPEWHSDRVSPSVGSIDGYGSGRAQRTLATWDPEDFESDFDRSCDSSVATCAMADADRRRFPMRAFG